ncbi:hypothetical protein RUND412_010955 [Rhizina undulata]
MLVQLLRRPTTNLITRTLPQLVLASSLRAMSTTPESYNSVRYKLIFYAPSQPLENIKEAIFAVGAGTFPGGKYSHCSFQSDGIGQFLPEGDKGANPHIGQKDEGSDEFRLERIEEVKCEIMCIGRDVLVKAVAALKKTHPYEEPAYEIYKMEDL